MGGGFKIGDIVKFDIIDKQFVSDGFAMGGIHNCGVNELEIFSKIDIETFPSWRDFKRPATKVKHGSYAMIIRKVGSPLLITDSYEEKWKLYDVYEIFTTHLTKRQVFAFNIIRAF